MLNSVSLAGRIGKLETKQTKSEKTYLQLRIAVPEYLPPKEEGEKPQELTNWVSVRVYGREKLRDTLLDMKGEQIAVSGKIRTYQVQIEGEQYPRNQMYIIADDISLFGSKRNQQESKEEGVEVPF